MSDPSAIQAASAVEQPVASGSTPRAASPPPPAVLPFAPPPLSKTHLTGSLDLLSHLSLLPSYDTYVRPWFRNPKPPVALLPGTGTAAGLEATTALTTEDKGKGKAVDSGRGKPAEGGGTSGPAHGQTGRNKKDTVVDLKRMKGDFEELVEECVVISSGHPAIPYPPSSLRHLVMEAPEEGPGFPPRWSDVLRVIPPEELEQWGWRLMEGRLPEADDVSLFVRTPKLQSEKKKKKPKRPRPSDDLTTGSGPGGQGQVGQQTDPNKRQKQNGGGALTPRTPGLTVGTPGASGRTPGARG